MYYQLKSFFTICDLQSVTLAAKQLHLTQPAVTQHIRHLERHFGVALLVRQGNRMQLTPEGKRLYDAAKDTVRDMERLRDLFTARDDRQHILKFSCIDSVIASILPPSIKRLLQHSPQAQLIPSIERSEFAMHEVLRGKLDLAICTVENIPKTLAYEILFHEPLIFIGSQAHRAIASMRELRSIPLILFPKSALTRTIIDSTFAVHKMTPHIVLETIKASAIVSFIEAGLGISLVPAYSVLHDLKSGRVYKIPVKTGAERCVGAVYPQNRRLSGLALKFIQLLREESKRLTTAVAQW